MNRLITISLLFVLIALSVKAQEDTHALHAADQLKKQLSVYLAEHPSSNLYLHLDKNIYSPEETVWFKAYLLGDTATDNKVIYVRIANDEKEIVLSAQFPMYDIRAHGNLALPKTLEEGKYTLYAYTDRMLSYGDTNVFVQPIRIRKNTGRKLEVEAMVSDIAQLVKGGKVQVTATIKENGKSAKNVKGEYELVAGEKSIKYGRLTANQFGEGYISFTYPELKDNQSLKVKMLFTRGNDYAELSLNLPHQGNPLTVNISPEGGQLIAGVAGKVAIEVLDIHDNPVSTTLLVKDAGQLVTKVSTNKLGIASISLKPETGSRYTVETATGKKTQIIPFPEVIKPAGYSLKLHKNKDQCTVTVYNRNQPGSALLVLRSAREILWSESITIASGDSLNVPVPAASFPKNILSLSVFDQENKPQAERLFLNREEEDYKVTILTDRQAYGMQKEVTVTINIADTAGNPVVANLSIGVTEKNRIDSAGFRNILQSWYYRPFGHAINRFLSAKSASEIDGLLVAGSWPHNTWSKISSYISKGLPVRLSNADAAIGQVIPTFRQKIGGAIVELKGKKIKEINIKAINRDFSLNDPVQNKMPFFSKVPIQVNADKTFVVPSSSLLSEKGKEWVLDIYTSTIQFEFDFLVQWKDHDIQFDSTLVKGGLLSSQEAMTTLASFKNPVVLPFSFKGANQLAEVTIGAREKTIQKKLRKPCLERGDIMNSIAVLKYHFTDFRKGGTYPWGFSDYGTPQVIIYLGCGMYRYIHYIKNITVPEEFPLPDYDNIPQPNEDTRSTIYWNPNIVTDAKGTATFSFFTSDVQGEFEIIAQGLEVNTFKPLMGTSSFKVKVNE